MKKPYLLSAHRWITCILLSDRARDARCYSTAPCHIRIVAEVFCDGGNSFGVVFNGDSEYFTIRKREGNFLVVIIKQEGEKCCFCSSCGAGTGSETCFSGKKSGIICSMLRLSPFFLLRKPNRREVQDARLRRFSALVLCCLYLCVESSGQSAFLGQYGIAANALHHGLFSFG